MPIYEYRCSNCGVQVEVLVRGGGEAPTCPYCGTALREKLFSVPYISTKGATHLPGHTCCGREERCETPPCSIGGTCRREG
jgi:putative FmdB family regulatory protein